MVKKILPERILLNAQFLFNYLGVQLIDPAGPEPSLQGGNLDIDQAGEFIQRIPVFRFKALDPINQLSILHLNRYLPFFSGADPLHVLNRINKDLSVSDLPGLGY